MARPSITDSQRDEMRQRILDATARVMRELNLAYGDGSGYERVTIRKVSAEAGISVGTFYSYFDGREDLGRALWAEPVKELRQEMKLSFEQATTPENKVRTLLEHYVRFAVTNPRLFRAYFLFVRTSDGCEKQESVSLENELFYSGLRQAFDQGQRSGAFRKFDGHKMAQLVWASIHGALALPINLDRYEFDDSLELADEMVEFLMQQISAE